MKRRYYFIIGFIAVIFFLFLGSLGDKDQEVIDRQSKIPLDAIKVNIDTDLNPVKSLSLEYYDPVPVSGGINTAGAEDSAFVMPDGNTLYFFFTPDTGVPVEEQLLDGVTGIYYSKKQGGEWQKAERILLQSRGKVALDGCEFISENVMLFCSAREGYEGINWFSAEYEEEKWIFDKKVDFPVEYEVGELHEFDGDLYYHSSREGGNGGLDIWKISRNSDGIWSEPENIKSVNSEGDEGWPAISPDGKELWISKDYSLWRSKKIDGQWQKPEKMFSPLAGESSIDKEGNVYFTHHFYKDNKMIEADIYIAKKK